MATQATLYAVLADPAVDTSFFTPNGYFRRDQRVTESLRWLNAYIFDFDNYGESVQDVLERIENAGLPRPTAIVRTPSGGHHAHFFFTKPVRATEKAERLYTAIMWHIADDLGADLYAVGANRIFRTPTEQNLIYFEPANRYDFDVFKNWREINHPFDPTSAGFFNVQTDDLMSHPALQRLLTAPCDYGSRDVVAFNLALAMKASNWSKEQAQSALKDWFISCCAKGAGRGKKPFTQRDATYKADSVYRSNKLHAPKAEIIRELSGLPFYYRTRKHWESAKPRSERELNGRIHLHEWEADLLALLETEKELSGTQQELATRLNCPITSFKAVLSQLKADGRVTVETRRGRGGLTVVRLPEPSQDAPAPDNVIDFPEPTAEPVTPIEAIREAVIVYADFRNKQIKRIERLPAAAVAEPEAPEPGPPD
ncbi:hypothetical protein [Paenibacillus validus]|uniref:hypothetical protein n=1 Tax=Paenibacillus validus TaxID=44253 RepID=UPI003D2A160A